jgi:hypothetical protein
MMESTDLGKCDALASGRRLDRAGIRTVFNLATDAFAFCSE